MYKISRTLYLLIILSFSLAHAADTTHEPIGEGDKKTNNCQNTAKTENIFMVWCSGYFTVAGKPRPKVGYELLEDFITSAVELLANDIYKITLITTKPDWEQFKTDKATCEQGGNLHLGTASFSPLFVEDLAYVMENKAVKEGVVSDDLISMAKFINSGTYKNMQTIFYSTYGSFLKEFEQNLGKTQPLPTEVGRLGYS